MFCIVTQNFVKNVEKRLRKFKKKILKKSYLKSKILIFFVFTFQFLSSDEPDMDISTDDSDSTEEESAEPEKHVGVVNSLGSVELYAACVNPKCALKKLDSNRRCPTCGSRVAINCSAVGIKTTIGILFDGKQTNFTVFNKIAEKLFEICTSESKIPESAKEFEDNLFEHLPKDVTFSMNATNILTHLFSCWKMCL